MNIKRAKQEIKDTIEAYFLKNEWGEYEIPAIRQRPFRSWQTMDSRQSALSIRV